MELINPNDKLSISINQDHCSGVQRKHFTDTKCQFLVTENWTRSHFNSKPWSHELTHACCNLLL